MECPRCGEEIRGGSECNKCSNRVIPSKEMEIQYKEFKVSELLDIKMASPVSRKEGIKSHEPAPGNKAGSDSAGKVEKEQTEEKPHIVLFAIIAFIAVMAGFYLLKFLF